MLGTPAIIANVDLKIKSASGYSWFKFHPSVATGGVGEA